MELKPDTYSDSDARSQAVGYIEDAPAKFKDDERAKKCKHDADGPIFTPVADLYPACRP